MLSFVHRPLSLTPPNSLDIIYTLIQNSLGSPTFDQSDTQCLSVNITAPTSEKHGLLPVLVFVHGGGFSIGSSSFPHYDLAAITRLSSNNRTPIIAVGINYRVGGPGFLHTPVLKSAGNLPNNGLRDQQLALRWIQHHIEGFGGDKDRVTCVGESAGAASGCYHLQSAEPLFQQLVIMSAPSLQVRPQLDTAARVFDRVADSLGAGKLTPEDQLSKLLRTPKEEFVAKVGRGVPLGPVVDGDIIRGIPTFLSMTDNDEVETLHPAIKHCRRIMVGDPQMDGMIFTSRLVSRGDILTKTLEQCLSKVLDPVDNSLTKVIVSEYGFDTFASSNSLQNILPILNFGNDLLFYLSARVFTRAWPKCSDIGSEAFQYHFNCPNLWDGPWKGHASHALDSAFLLQNFNSDLSSGQAKVAERFAKDLIMFINGKDAWPAYRCDGGQGSMVYYATEDGKEDLSRFVPDETPESIGRRDILDRVVGETRFDLLMVAWKDFMTYKQ
ncbi:alpha/beta-hydrolase [Cadophora sp. DSE1049]|nr:alpha/beta-hydrolase [Cadophora sp. DSE1049]